MNPQRKEITCYVVPKILDRKSHAVVLRVDSDSINSRISKTIITDFCISAP
jgi:hypothetical protein